MAEPHDKARRHVDIQSRVPPSQFKRCPVTSFSTERFGTTRAAATKAHPAMRMGAERYVNGLSFGCTVCVVCLDPLQSHRVCAHVFAPTSLLFVVDSNLLEVSIEVASAGYNHCFNRCLANTTECATRAPFGSCCAAWGSALGPAFVQLPQLPGSFPVVAIIRAQPSNRGRPQGCMCLERWPVLLARCRCSPETKVGGNQALQRTGAPHRIGDSPFAGRLAPKKVVHPPLSHTPLPSRRHACCICFLKRVLPATRTINTARSFD